MHGVAGHQPLAAQPSVETAPARHDECNAAATAATGMHLRHPAADVVVLHLHQRHTGLRGQHLQFAQVECVQLDGAGGQALLEAHVLQVTLHQD